MKASEKYFNEVVESSGHKMKTSFNNVKKVCDIFDNQKVRIIVSKVGSECDNLFGSPKIQSIRNNPLLKKYIDLRISEQVLNIKENDILNGSKIKDPVLKAEFNLLEDKVRTLKLENEGLKHLFKNIEIGLEGGKVGFLKERNKELGEVVGKTIKALYSLGCDEYRGRLCLNKDIILDKEEWLLLKSMDEGGK